MKSSRFLLTALAALLIAVPGYAEIKAGFADRDISPDIGMERPGGYGKGFHQSFHDPCKARAAVFNDGSKVVALVGLDALFIREPQVAAIRKAVNGKTGIDPLAVLIGASHSHSSGPTGMVLPGEFDHASKEVQELAYEQSSAADPVYLERMINGVVEAVVEAFEKRQAVTLGFGSGREDSVSFNRRWRMNNGLSFTHPRYGNPGRVFHRVRAAAEKSQQVFVHVASEPGQRLRRLRAYRRGLGAQRWGLRNAADQLQQSDPESGSDHPRQGHRTGQRHAAGRVGDAGTGGGVYRRLAVRQRAAGVGVSVRQTQGSEIS